MNTYIAIDVDPISSDPLGMVNVTAMKVPGNPKNSNDIRRYERIPWQAVKQVLEGQANEWGNSPKKEWDKRIQRGEQIKCYLDGDNLETVDTMFRSTL